MTAPKNFRTVPCLGCGAPVPLKGSNTRPYCKNNYDCGLAYATWMAFNNVDKVGDCEVWRGKPKGGETFRVRMRVGKSVVDPRVLDLRAGSDAVGKYKRYRKLCDTPGCVVLDHHEAVAQKPPSLTINVKLPSQPFLDYYDRLIALDKRPKVTESQRVSIKDGRSKGYFTVTRADELCIDVLDIHPSFIYGDLFWEAA